MNAKQREQACHRLLDKQVAEISELRKQLAEANEQARIELNTP